jgi:hypothetical protein
MYVSIFMESTNTLPYQTEPANKYVTFVQYIFFIL